MLLLCLHQHKTVLPARVPDEYALFVRSCIQDFYKVMVMILQGNQHMPKKQKRKVIIHVFYDTVGELDYKTR